MLLFVYGSLQKGLWNNFWLDKAIFVSLVKTFDKYSLFTVNNVIPKMYIEPRYIEPRYQIFGELYDILVDDLVSLDNHEGIDTGYYTRDLIKVVDKNGKEYQTYAYIARVTEDEDKHVGHGNYKKFILELNLNFVKKEIVQLYNKYDW